MGEYMKFVIEYMLTGSVMGLVLVGMWYLWRAVDCTISHFLGVGC